MITDAAGRPVAGTAVTFAVASGGGSVSPTTPVPSDASGVAATTSWTLGPAVGPNTITATAPGLAGSPVTFTATGEGVVTNTTVQVGNGTQLVFVPKTVTISVGGTVTWVWNSGGTQHNVTTSSESPSIPGTPSTTSPSPFTFGPVRFDAPGTYRYYCSVHATPTATQGMVGTVTVQ